MRCDKCPLLFLCNFSPFPFPKAPEFTKQTIPAENSSAFPTKCTEGGKKRWKGLQKHQRLFLESWNYSAAITQESTLTYSQCIKLKFNILTMYFNSNDIFDCVHLDENMYEVTIHDHTIMKYMYLFKNYSKYMNHS